MAGKYGFFAVVTSVLLLNQVAPAGLPVRGSFTVETKATAAEQYAYATALSRNAESANEPLLTAMKVAAALEVIPKRWPANRAMSLRAYREIVTRLAAVGLHQNATEVCDRAIKFADAARSSDALVFHAAKGRSLASLGRRDEAQAEFRTATGGAFHQLPNFDQSSILIDAVLFYERDHQYALAAKHAHARASVAGTPLGAAEALRKAIELSLAANDRIVAKAYLAEFVDALHRLRMAPLKPDEQEALRRLESAGELLRTRAGA